MNRHNWMWVDWLIFSFRCGWYGVGVIFYFVNEERLGDLGFTGFLLFASLAFIIPLLFWRPGYIHPTYYILTELMITTGFSVFTNNILGISLSTSILLMPILMVGYLLTRKTAPWAVPMFLIVLPANRYWTIDTMFNFYLQYIDVLLFFYIGVGFNRITKSQVRYKQLLEKNTKQYQLIQEQNMALKQYAAEVEKLALVEERNRMARDLHDTIGHYFTSLTVGLDAVSYMVKSHPQLASEQIDRLATLAREGLTEVRRTIHDIAPDDEILPLDQQLKKIAHSFGEHTNTTIQFQSKGSAPELPSHLKLTLIRCLQESMTNAKRHGEASYIHIALSYQEQGVTLVVFNNGKQMDTEVLGFGLRSMKARLAELQGSLDITSNEDGVTVTCMLPLRRNSYEENQTLVSG